jgi:hypothetical protein
MKELLDKISSYNLFNYLLPGILFAVLAERITKYSFVQDNIVTGVFVYYLIGLAISRIGSLLIEPLLKKLCFIRFADYKDFVAASKKDEKLEVLSEANNTYRTLCSLSVLLLLLKVYERIEDRFSMLKDCGGIILVVLLLLIFLFAYRKQTLFVLKRIKANK